MSSIRDVWVPAYDQREQERKAYNIAVAVAFIILEEYPEGVIK